MSNPHQVRIVVNGENNLVLNNSESFNFNSDMLELADDFEITESFDFDTYLSFPTDSEVEIFFDDTLMFFGFSDTRRRVARKESSTIDFSGRDKGGRIIDESAPLKSFKGKTLLDLGKDVAGDWFDSVSLSNARNRRLISGSNKSLAPVSKEPAVFMPRDISKKVEPGETRAQVIQEFLEKAQLLAWSSSDGKEFIIGKPNYEQAAQYEFIVAGPDSSRETNVVSLTIAENIAEMYSEYVACGSSQGNSANYGKNVTKRRASAFDAPANKVDGVGNRFRHRKRMIISDDDIRSVKQAQERARREKALRLYGFYEIQVEVDNWGQRYDGKGDIVFYSFDKMARVVDEETFFESDCLITRVQFAETRNGGQVATISLVPIGTELAFS